MISLFRIFSKILLFSFSFYDENIRLNKDKFINI